MQAKKLGFAYFADIMNYQQMIMCGLYTIYFFKRIQNPSQTIIPITGSPMADQSELVFWVVSNSILTMMCGFYFLFYSRIYEQFSLFVNICVEVLLGLVNFMIFLFFWIVLFGQLYLIAGSNVEDDKGDKSDYANLGPMTKQLMESWRNTIGDISRPSYVIWMNSI